MLHSNLLYMKTVKRIRLYPFITNSCADLVYEYKDLGCNLQKVRTISMLRFMRDIWHWINVFTFYLGPFIIMIICNICIILTLVKTSIKVKLL